MRDTAPFKSAPTKAHDDGLGSRDRVGAGKTLPKTRFTTLPLPVLFHKNRIERAVSALPVPSVCLPFVSS